MSIQELFDRSSKTYDRDRRQLIPCYDDFYTISVEIIPFHKDRELRVLDLGAGTGLLSAAVAARYPRALLTLVDLSPAMLRVAEQRFADGKGERITFQVMNYCEKPLTGTYDLVISALSSHHLADTAKIDLFGKIHTILEPGGMFINADLVRGENVVAEKICSHTWLRKVREKGIKEETLDAALERTKEDRLSPLSSQMEWLREAGFIDVANWYRYYSFAVFSGTKALAGQ